LTYEQYEVAFAASCKGEGMEEEAMRILIDCIHSLPRAQAFAEKIDRPSVWTMLAEASLVECDVEAAVDALLRAENVDFLSKVTQASERSSNYAFLAKYVSMVRSSSKSRAPEVETEILYCLVKIGDIVELQNFVETSKLADFHSVANRCRSEKLYEAACVLFQKCNDMNALSLTYAEMGSVELAVESAEKANNLQTWKQLIVLCFERKELDLANRCARNIISNADEIHEIIELYEKNKLFNDVITVLQDFLGSSNAHMGAFTELAILYVKYYPEKSFDFVKMHHQRINKHKLNVYCREMSMWEICCFLYQTSNEWDNAANVMLTEPAYTFEHELLLNILSKVSVDDTIDKAIEFYFSYQPALINELLIALRNRLDIDRIIRLISKNTHAFITMPFLDTMLAKNVAKVNDLFIDLCIQEDDIKGLRKIVENTTSFDVDGVCRRLESDAHQSIRLLGAKLLSVNNKPAKAVEVYQAEKLYVAVFDISVVSCDEALIDQCMDWFIQENRKDCFAALALGCVSSFPPDVVLAKAYLHDEVELLMPYFVKVTKLLTHRLNTLEETSKQDLSAKDSAKKKSTQLLLK